MTFGCLDRRSIEPRSRRPSRSFARLLNRYQITSPFFHIVSAAFLRQHIIDLVNAISDRPSIKITREIDFNGAPDTLRTPRHYVIAVVSLWIFGLEANLIESLAGVIEQYVGQTVAHSGQSENKSQAETT
jgi:hypothetical protein